MNNLKVTSKIYLFLFSILFISLISAQVGLGVFGQEDCIELIQTCDSCTYNNVSRVLFPNGTLAISTEKEMTKDGTFYNYTFCSTTAIGEYYVYGHGDLSAVDTVWSYTFDITGSGTELTTAGSIVYLGIFIVLIFLLVITIGTISLLPSRNNQDDEGNILSINNLKHLRPVLWVFSYGLVMAIIFIGSNISLAYLGSSMVGNLLLAIYKVMLALAPIFAIVWILYIFWSIFSDQKLERLINQGITESGGYNF